MKLSNDNRTVLIAVLVNIVFIALFVAGWSAWVHLFQKDYHNKQKQKEQAKVKRFERPEPTPEQKAEFKRRREAFMKLRTDEMKLRSELISLLKKNNASVAKIAAEECDLTLAKMRMMRRRRSANGVSGAELVVKSFYAAKAAPEKVDMNSEESIRLAIADIQYKQQQGALRRFMNEEEFKEAAENWCKVQSDENLKALCEAEKNVPEMMPHRRMKK